MGIMYVGRLLFVSFSLSCLSSIALNAGAYKGEHQEIRGHAKQIVKINENLYVYQLGEDLHLVLEKYGPHNQHLWGSFIAAQEIELAKAQHTFAQKEHEYLREINSKIESMKNGDPEELQRLQKNKEELQINFMNLPEIKRLDNIRKTASALNCFRMTMKYHDKLIMGEEEIKDLQNIPEMWVAYAISDKTPPTTAYLPKDLPKVEMLMTVSTSGTMPFITNMGITRAATYSLTPHALFSVKLHAFAGSVLKRLYPEKYYMITVPEKIGVTGKGMETLLLQSGIPKASIWVGDSENDLTAEIHPAVIVKSNLTTGGCAPNALANWRLLGKEGQVLVSLTSEGIKQNRWFFCGTCTNILTPKLKSALKDSLHYVTVELNELNKKL
jgi:hypothetical protein